MDELTCGLCDGKNVTTTQEHEILMYGEPGDQQGQIPLMLTVRHCGDCSECWTDEIGESERDGAVARWLATNPYRCPVCHWKGAKPIRPTFGVVACPECSEKVIVTSPVITKTVERTTARAED